MKPLGSRRDLVLWAARALLLAAAGRVLALAIPYLSGSSTVHSFHVESAAILYGIVAIAVLLLTGESRDGNANDDRRLPLWSWAAWCAGAIVLYWPSIRIGLLSDDFVLADRAMHWRLGAVHAEFFRPLPLVIWALLLRLDPSATTLHVFNVVAHGTAAFLVSRLSAPFARSRTASAAAGMLFLAFPSAVEAVTWCSGVFDVTATVFVILTMLASRLYGSPAASRARIAFFVCAASAFLCKETAAVTPLLVLHDAWALRRLRRSLLVDNGFLLVLFGAIGMARVIAGSPLLGHPITKYLVQRWLFGAIGGLAVPWHRAVMQSMPAIPVVGLVSLVALATAFALARPSRQCTRQAILCAGSVLTASLPTMTFFFVGPDLQGSRYLYLSTASYSALLVLMASSGGQRWMRCLSSSVLVTLVGIGCVGTRVHQDPWRAAGRLRDAVQDAARYDARMQECQRVATANLPESIDGAYVLRNGGEFALGRVGLQVDPASTPACHFRWDEQGRRFVPTAAR